MLATLRTFIYVYIHLCHLFACYYMYVYPRLVCIYTNLLTTTSIIQVYATCEFQIYPVSVPYETHKQVKL